MTLSIFQPRDRENLKYPSKQLDTLEKKKLRRIWLPVEPQHARF